jgi:hypothetical protein
MVMRSDIAASDGADDPIHRQYHHYSQCEYCADAPPHFGRSFAVVHHSPHTRTIGREISHPVRQQQTKASIIRIPLKVVGDRLLWLTLEKM